MVPGRLAPQVRPRHRLRQNCTGRRQAGKLGYAIRADEQGRGYAAGAARTLAAFGFDVLGLHRISAAIGPDNAPSVAVARHFLGFQYEGRLRDHVFTNGAWRDSVLYSILPQEWIKLRAPEQAHG